MIRDAVVNVAVLAGVGLILAAAWWTDWRIAAAVGGVILCAVGARLAADGRRMTRTNQGRRNEPD